MLSESNISYKPFWGICRPLNSWRANSPNPIQIYCAIIAMSANAFEEDKKKAFDVKMNDYITKPIDFQKMEQVLKHILSK